MAEYNMPQYILREFKVTDARVSADYGRVKYLMTWVGSGFGYCTCCLSPVALETGG